MNAIEQLAHTCVGERLKRADEPDTAALRSEFERLSNREKILRDYAGQMDTVSGQLGARHNAQGSGRIGTFLKRLLVPAPYTLPEAALRAGGAIGGASYAINRLKPEEQPIGPEDLARVLTPTDSKGRSLAQVLQHPFMEFQRRSHPLPAGTSDSVASMLAGNPPENVYHALNPASESTRTPIQTALRGDISKLVPPEIMTSPLWAAAKQMRPQPETPATVPTTHKVLAGILGGYLGSVVTGIPHALRAAWRAGGGGEQSVQAAGKAQTARAEADQHAQAREKILSILGGQGKTAEVLAPLLASGLAGAPSGALAAYAGSDRFAWDKLTRKGKLLVVLKGAGLGALTGAIPGMTGAALAGGYAMYRGKPVGASMAGTGIPVGFAGGAIGGLMAREKNT